MDGSVYVRAAREEDVVAHRRGLATARIRAVHQVADIGFRPSMEDRHVVEMRPQVGLFAGVYDGHGGKEAVEVVEALLHRAFFEALDEASDPLEAFRRAYRLLEERLAGVESGTTATTVFLQRKMLSYAHVGDGGILLVATRPTALIRPHRLDDPAERSRILATGGTIEGGYVVRGARGLMPTRSFGDSYFRPVGVTAVPTTGERSIGVEERFLVVACDGLFDVLPLAEIAEILHASGGAARGGEALRTEVLARGGMDNLTIVVVEFEAGTGPSARSGEGIPGGGDAVARSR